MNVWGEGACHSVVPSAVATEIIMRRGIAEEIQLPAPEELFKETELFSGLDLISRRPSCGDRGCAYGLPTVGT